jgi:hypothetical protein
MKCSKIIVIFLLVCLVVLSGCDSGPTGPSHGLSAATYLPLEVGATWTYAKIGTEQGEAFKDTTTGTIVGTTTITYNNKTYFAMVYDNKTYFAMVESDEDSTYLRIKNNIVYQFVPGEFQEIPIYNFNEEVGQTWEIFTESGTMGSMTATGEFLGTDNINVPAGTFTNCAKFEHTINITVFSNTGGSPRPFESIGIIWLAPSVGVVKYTEEVKENSKVMRTSTVELISYSIPQRS